MTRGEIQVVVFLVLALLAGATVKWLRGSDARTQVPTGEAPAAPGWARPPYIFKSAKEAREAHAQAKSTNLSSQPVTR